MASTVVSLNDPDTLVDYSVQLYERVGRCFKSRFGILEVSAEIIHITSILAQRLKSGIAFRGLDPLTCPAHELRVVSVLSAALTCMTSTSIVIWSEDRLLYPSRADILQVLSDIWCLKALLCESCKMIDEYAIDRT